MQKRKIAAVVLAVFALTLALGALNSLAANDEFFTAINNSVRPFTKQTMPFYRDGEYYVPYKIFDERILGIYYSHNLDRYTLTLYNKNYTLTFDSPAQVAYDRDRQYDMQLAVNDAGEICVPMKFVCEKFGLQFEVLRTHPIETIRIVTGTGWMDERTFRETHQPALVATYMSYIMPSAEPTATAAPSAAPSASPSTSPSAEPSPEPDPVVVYLTFDDGPNKNTESILDTLAEHDMKATFFLLGTQIEEHRDTVRRLVGEGHSVGLHAYSHEADSMYDSPSSLLLEIERAGDALDAVAQVRSRLFRFPYGSSYSDVSEAMRDEVIAAGYRYWDWTIDALDYEQESPESLAETVISGLAKADSTAVVLMHDTATTASALDAILDYVEGGNFIVRTINVGDMPVNFFGDVRTSPVD